MPTDITLPGFEGRSVTVQSSFWSGQPKLIVDGQEVPPTSQNLSSSDAPLPPPGQKAPRKGQRNEFLLRQNDGREVLVRIKSSFPDPAPILEVNGQTIRTARPLTAFEWIWAAFPIVLLVLGGAIGGAIGAFAAVTNINFIRDESKGLLRYVMCAVVTTSAFLVWVVIAALIQGALKR